MKLYQAKEVLDLGADEIDMVMNIPALKNGEEELFIRDVEGVVQAAGGEDGQGHHREQLFDGRGETAGL